jgi:uncharacterized protein YrrD
MATKRATDVIGKSVVSAATGEKLGTVGDVLFDEHTREWVALIVRHGVLRTENVLPAEAVQSLGADAVVSRSDHLTSAKEWRTREFPPPPGDSDARER